jgi:hypothetical protein
LLLVRLEAHIDFEEAAGETAQEQPAHETVEVAFVCQYNFWLG